MSEALPVMTPETINNPADFVPEFSTTSDRPAPAAAPSPARQPDRPAPPAKTPEEQNRQIAAEWQERRTAALERYGDYAEVAESEKTAMTTPMAHAIINAEFGPDIAYWLGKNQKEAARIAAMPSPIQQALAIGRIEARLAGGSTAGQPPQATRPVRPRSLAAQQSSATDSSQERIGRMVAELQKQNMPLGWGQ